MIFWDVFVKGFGSLAVRYQYSQRITLGSHHGSSRPHVPCSSVTVFVVYRPVPIGFSYCVSLHQGFTATLLSINVKGPLPPGPRGLPILGNIFQIPKFQWLKYTEWQEVFGNPFSLSVSFSAEECQVPSSR